MKKPIFIRRNLVLLLLILAFSGFQYAPKQNGAIVLQDERVNITPKEFYIANVIDARDDRSAVAWLLPAGSIPANQSKVYPVDLRGGALVAVKRFVDHNLPRNEALRPVVISLKKFKVTESALTGGQVEGHVALVMSFDLERGEEEVSHLATYNSSAIYTRNAGLPQEIEPALRHMLENGLVYINIWIDKQADTNIKLAKGVKVIFTDYTEKPEGDTIYYSVNRLLTWGDFQSKIANDRYDAEVFPSVGYNEHIEVIKGIINIRLDIKVNLPKSACWVKDGSRTDYALNHEQRHFDIVKIIAEHFKQKIKNETLPVDNFDGPINVEYLETYREMHNMQKQYDDETRHGSDRLAQQNWNERIDKELKGYGVKR